MFFRIGATYGKKYGNGSRNQIIFGCVHILASALLEISRRSRKMSGRSLTSIAGTCLFLAAIFFLPCLTPEAGAQVMSGSGVVDDEEGATVAYPFISPGTGLPSSVDLRKEMPPVADQGDSGSMSCTTFATVYYQMSQYVKHFKHPSWDLKNPEHQFSVAFALSQFGQGYASKVYDVLYQYGCVDAAEMQYNQWTTIQPTVDQFEAAKPYRISGCTAVWDHGLARPPYDPPNPIQKAKAWLAKGHVLSVTIDPGSPGFPGASGNCTPSTRFYDIVASSHIYTPGHGVAICGFNDNINPSGKSADHRGGFLMVNSEGPQWNGNMHGYIWLSYAYVKQYISDCWIMMMDNESDAPVITGCMPQYNGTILLISGTNFGSYRRLASVTFNGVRADRILSWTNELVTVTAPSCFTSGSVVLYNWEDTPSNSFPFEIN